MVRLRRERGMPRAARCGCDDAGRWIMWIAPLAWAGVFVDGVVRCPYRHISAGRPELPWDRLGIAAWNSGGPGSEPVVE
jgi:hypothetical protein